MRRQFPACPHWAELRKTRRSFPRCLKMECRETPSQERPDPERIAEEGKVETLQAPSAPTGNGIEQQPASPALADHGCKSRSTNFEVQTFRGRTDKPTRSQTINV